VDVACNSLCIHSQLKLPSSSAVASMIEKVLRHCTEMEVEVEVKVDHQYDDSHAQSTVVLVFCRLLGFKQLPRLKAIHKQKLYQPEAGMANVQRPIYKAMVELGKVIKMIYLFRYLHSEVLRREINGGLNVVEKWNGTKDFVFFARRVELSSNRLEDHEINMLALHLIQNCMIYINTLMLLQVLFGSHGKGGLTERGLTALTPLIWEHVNPYTRFELDMTTRLDLQ